MKPTRRQVLVGLLSAGAAGAVAWHFWPDPARLKEAGLPTPFGAAQRAAIAAATERVLPGAIAAGVPEFIDYWLVREPFVDAVLKGFEIGATELDRLGKERHGDVFARLAGADQDAILGTFERGELEVKNFTGRGFFEQLVKFTLEGFLSHPRYGGNRDGVGWEFIGQQHHFWAPAGLGIGTEPDVGEEPAR